MLAERLDGLPAGQRLAVANAGVSGNTVSVQPNPYDPTGQCCGPPAPERLDRDVLSIPGLRAVLLLEGTNDLGGGTNAPPAPAAQVIDAMRTIASRVHDRHVRIIAVTILPMCNPPGGPKEAARLAVNTWIRTSGTFDALLRDPADPTQMISDLRNDCYHPNAAGDTLLGEHIPLGTLTADPLPLRLSVSVQRSPQVGSGAAGPKDEAGAVGGASVCWRRGMCCRTPQAQRAVRVQVWLRW